jgi:hypothetical protein
MEDELLIDAEHGRAHADFFRVLDLAQKFIGCRKEEDARSSTFIIGSVERLLHGCVELDLRVTVLS